MLFRSGGLAGGAGGGWLGGRVWGEGSDGQKWAMLGGSLVGGACGAKGGSQINNTVQAAGLIRATHTEAISRIESMSAAKRGPVLTGIRDSITGKIHFGENFDLSKAQGRKAFQDFKKNAHPLVKERIINQEKAIAEGITTPSPRAGTPGAHSEVVALDKAIKARELMTGQKVTEADLSTFKLHNQSMMNAHPASRMNRCDNCAVITDGVTVIGHE